MPRRAKTPSLPAVLAVDIGNSTTAFGVVRGAACQGPWRVASDARRTPEEYAVLIGGILGAVGLEPESWDGVVIGSVVPALTPTIAAAIEMAAGHRPLCLTHAHRFPVRNRYDRPADAGMDRLANASAALAIVGKPAIVVDAGTAVTLDVVDKSGAFVGGAVLPGPSLSLDALARGTSRLPLLDPAAPAAAIGGSTSAAIRSGVVLGLAGAVDHLIRETQRELGARAAVVATGGAAPALASHSKLIKRLEPMLTLQGLAQIWLLNRRQR